MTVAHDSKFKKEVILATGAGGFFGQSLYAWESMDIGLMQELFRGGGYSVRQFSFEALSTRVAEVEGAIVVYSSSQTPGYRDYIEDILISLSLRGNHLVPSFEMFRAHENKGFQELLKQLYAIDLLPGRYYSGWRTHGSTESFSFPCVLKWTEGSRSHGVRLVRDRRDLHSAVSKHERLPRGLRLYAAAKKYLYPRKYNRAWYEMIRPTKRFVVQAYEANLVNDYKVIALGDFFFCLERGVRRGDFRASGSGLREFIEPTVELLEYSRSIFARFDEPFLSMDICKVESGFGLIEFQGTHFGPFTVMKAPFAYRKAGDSWQEVPGPFILEELFVESICRHLSQMACG